MSISPTATRLMRWQGRHRVMADSVLAALVLGLDVLLGVVPVLSEGMSSAASWLPITTTAIILSTATLCLRRTRPATAWAVGVVVPALHDVIIHHACDLDSRTLAIVSTTLNAYVLIGTPLCLTALAMRYRVSWSWAATLVSGAPSLLVDIRLMDMSLKDVGILYLFQCLIFAIATLIGMILRIQEVQLHEVEMRSARLALAREQEALLAAANERSRIAREMHDVVAHSLAVMITMADGAVAAIDRSPDMAKEALEVLAETGRSALADTRRLVGVLRDDPETSAPSAPTALVPEEAGGSIGEEPGEPVLPGGPRPRSSSPAGTGPTPVVRDLPVPEFAPPGTVAPVEPSEEIVNLRREATGKGADASRGDTPMAPAPEQADLAALVARFKAAGIPVTYAWNGHQLPDDKGLQLTLFRIAQESLTNVLRYAPTTQAVTVSVDRHVGTAVLTVDNDAAPGSTPMHGSGKGLIGMRERAAVYGGTVQAGPTATGWRVRAVLRWDEDDERTSPWQLPL